MSSSVVVLIGPSGAGKSNVVKVLCEQHGFTLVKTVTTRPQRDKFDTDHQFISTEQFQALQEAKAFFGVLNVFDAQYGLPKFNPTEKTVLNLRAPVVQEFLTKFPDAFVVEIDAPLEILQKRLAERGTEERFEPEKINKEIQLGRQLATQTIDSLTKTPQEIAANIIGAS